MCDEKPLGNFMYGSDMILYFYLKNFLNINFLDAELT